MLAMFLRNEAENQNIWPQTVENGDDIKNPLKGLSDRDSAYPEAFLTHRPPSLFHP